VLDVVAGGLDGATGFGRAVVACRHGRRIVERDRKQDADECGGCGEVRGETVVVR
jgi:hypothetical protein